MKFLEFIKEAAQQAAKTKKPSTSAKGKTAADKKLDDKHVAITFGRFNPPHAGHGKLLDAVKAHGGDSGNYRIYPSRSQDHKKNPLSAQQKVDHMRKMFKNHKDASKITKHIGMYLMCYVTFMMKDMSMSLWL